MVPEGVSWLMGAQGKPDKQDQSVGDICTLLCRKAKEAPEVFLHFFKACFLYGIYICAADDKYDFKWWVYYRFTTNGSFL